MRNGQSMEERMARLERELRRWRLLGAVVAVALPALLLPGACSKKQTALPETIVLKAADGKRTELSATGLEVFGPGDDKQHVSISHHNIYVAGAGNTRIEAASFTVAADDGAHVALTAKPDHAELSLLATSGVSGSITADKRYGADLELLTRAGPLSQKITLSLDPQQLTPNLTISRGPATEDKAVLAVDEEDAYLRLIDSKEREKLLSTRPGR